MWTTSRLGVAMARSQRYDFPLPGQESLTLEKGFKHARLCCKVDIVCCYLGV